MMKATWKQKKKQRRSKNRQKIKLIGKLKDANNYFIN